VPDPLDMGLDILATELAVDPPGGSGMVLQAELPVGASFLSARQALIGRIGRGTKPPPQVGQTL